MSRRLAVSAKASAVLILAVVLSPALWLLQMSFRHNADIMSTRLIFAPTLENYAALWTGQFRSSFVNSLLASGAVHRCLAAARRAGGLCAGALAVSRRTSHRAVDSGHAHGAADRLHHSVFPGLHLGRI